MSDNMARRSSRLAPCGPDCRSIAHAWQIDHSWPRVKTFGSSKNRSMGRPRSCATACAKPGPDRTAPREDGNGGPARSSARAERHLAHAIVRDNGGANFTCKEAAPARGLLRGRRRSGVDLIVRRFPGINRTGIGSAVASGSHGQQRRQPAGAREQFLRPFAPWPVSAECRCARPHARPRLRARRGGRVPC
jgi:hypothetical protein